MYCIAIMRMAKATWRIQTKTGARMQNCFGFVDIDGVMICWITESKRHG